MPFRIIIRDQWEREYDLRIANPRRNPEHLEWDSSFLLVALESVKKNSKPRKENFQQKENTFYKPLNKLSLYVLYVCPDSIC